MSSPITSDYLMGLLTGKSDPNDFYKRYPHARPSDSDAQGSESEKSESEGDESRKEEAQDEEKEEDESQDGPARKRTRIAPKPEEMDDATLKRELEALLSHHTSAKGPHPSALPLAREHYERASDKLMTALARLVNNGPVSLHSLLKGWTMIYSLVGESEARRFDELRRAKREALVMVRRAEGRADCEVEENEDDEKVIEEALVGDEGKARNGDDPGGADEEKVEEGEEKAKDREDDDEGEASNSAGEGNEGRDQQKEADK